jgi:hypothetical protein
MRLPIGCAPVAVAAVMRVSREPREAHYATTAHASDQYAWLRAGKPVVVHPLGGGCRQILALNPCDEVQALLLTWAHM